MAISTAPGERGMMTPKILDSPHPEAYAASSNQDDSNMPVDIFRTWFIGIMH